MTTLDELIFLGGMMFLGQKFRFICSHVYLIPAGHFCTHLLLSPPRSDPKKTENNQGFLPVVKDDETFLHTYNCNWEPFPREHTKVHRSKQVRVVENVLLWILTSSVS